MLLLLAVVCLGVAPVIAVPLAEYHDTLDHIIADLESLSQKEENETDAVFESRFSETIEAMRGEFRRRSPSSWTKRRGTPTTPRFTPRSTNYNEPSLKNEPAGSPK